MWSLSPCPSPGALGDRGKAWAHSQLAGRLSTLQLKTSTYPQDNPRLTEDFVAHLETELEQSRLRETETLGALREMQDKVLDMEKV